MPFMCQIERLAKEEGIQQGIQQGILKDLRESITEFLEIRYHKLPVSLSKTINRIEDVSVLKQLYRQTIIVSSIAEFQQLLPHQDKES